MTRRARRSTWLLALAWVAVVIPAPRQALAADVSEPEIVAQATLSDWKPVFVGVALCEASTAAPRPLQVRAARIDLQEPTIRFTVTPSNGEREGEVDARRSTEFLTERKCQLAINASFFAGEYKPKAPLDVIGLCVSEGDLYSHPQGKAALLISKDNRVWFDAPPYERLDQTHNAVAGSSIILADGKITVDPNIKDGFTAGQHPRSAAGTTRDGRYLILMTIDGRQPGYSEGTTLIETAEWLRRLGAWDGLNLDGGGSTNLVIEGEDGQPELVNRPKSTWLRYCANHLGVYARRLDTPGAPDRWTIAQAAAWQRDHPWLVGCNYTPSTAINQLEMWQADTFDLETIDRELGWAEALGFNSVRVFLHHLLWQQDRAGFLERIDAFLNVADRHGIGAMLVPLDGVWDPHPRLGKQRAPRPHVHNSGWVQSPGAEILRDPTRHAELEPYIKGVIAHFRNDPRVQVWDLYNEPENPNEAAYGSKELPNKGEMSLLLLREVFTWAREVRPSQPLTCGVWRGTWGAPEKLTPMERFQLEASDVISFHAYGSIDEVRKCVENLQRYKRPILCTEYMARPRGSTFDPILGYFKKKHVGAYNWGFVAGKTQTNYPWDSWEKQYTTEPPVWFHDIFRPTGTPYIAQEVAYIRSITGAADRKPPDEEKPGPASRHRGRATALRGAIRHVHDPVIIREQDAYYIFSTGPGVPMRRSRDMRNWKRIGRVFAEDVPAWACEQIPGARDVWAPDISYYNDRYHLYYSVSTFGSQRSCIGLATNTTLDPASPDYGWVDHGKVIESFPDRMDFNAIDPNLVLDQAGQPWLAWGSYWGGIKLARLNPETGKRLDEAGPIHALAARPTKHAIEAPFLTYHDGHYYLFVSFDKCCRGVASNYKIMVGRSREITGPYVDYHGRPMRAGHATTVLAGYDEFRGPGHNGILRQSGDDWLVHHMYDARAKGRRTLQIRPLIWGRDGWPVVGEPLKASAPASDSRRVTTEDLVGTWKHSVEFGAVTYHELLPGGRMKSAVDNATWSLDSGILELRWPDPAAPNGTWVDTCDVAPDGAYYVGRNQRGLVVRGTR
jgi:hypothetical protein